MHVCNNYCPQMFASLSVQMFVGLSVLNFISLAVSRSLQVCLSMCLWVCVRDLLFQITYCRNSGKMMVQKKILRSTILCTHLRFKNDLTSSEYKEMKNRMHRDREKNDCCKL